MVIRPLTLLLALGPLVAGAQEAPPTPPPAPPEAQVPEAPEEAQGEEAPRPKTFRERFLAKRKSPEIAGTTSLMAEGAPTPLERTPGHVRVFTSNDIAQSGARTLGEFLAYVIPGQALSTGQPGQTSSGYLGGSRPQDLQVLLDGVRISDPSSAAVDLNMIPLVGIDRVEVSTGGGSARFGGHAMGGVVALYSAGTTGAGTHGEVLIGGGGQQKRGGVMPGLGWEGGYVRFGATRYEDKPTVDAQHVYRQGTVFGSFGQKLSERTNLTLTYRNFYQTVPLPFQEATPLEREYNPDRYAELRGNQVALGFQFAVDPRFSWDFRVGGMNLRRSDPPDADNPTGPQKAFDSSRLQVGGGFHWRPAQRWGLSVLLEGEKERATLPGYLGGEDQGRGRTVSLGVEVRYDLTDSLRLVAQGRQDWQRQTFSGADGSSRDLGSYRPGTFRLGLNQAFKWGIHAYAAIGTGYNTPLLIQTMENARVGGTTLTTERSRFAQVGVGLERGGFSVRLELARTTYHDLIAPNSSLQPAVAGGLPNPPQGVLVPCEGGTGPNGTLLGYCNSGSVRVQGLESTFGYRAPWRIPLVVEGFVRNQEARDLGAPAGLEFKTGNVQNRPFTTHGFRTSLGGARVKVETRWNRVGRRFENVHTFACDTLEPLVTATYVTYDDLSVTTTYSYNRLFQLVLRGEHLAQKNLSVTDWQGKKTDLQNNAALLYGIPAPKPTFTMELRFRY